MGASGKRANACEVEAGLSHPHLGAEVGNRAQSAPGEPLPRHGVRRHGIHVDKPCALRAAALHGHKIVCGLSVRFAALLQIDGIPRNQQLRAAPGVFHMHPLLHPADLHPGDEAVQAFEKHTLSQMFILHVSTTLPLAN